MSNEGGVCPHVRDLGDRLEVASAPRHGEVTRELQGGKTVISYRPEPGYVGSDSFALRSPARKVALSYLVGVLPGR